VSVINVMDKVALYNFLSTFNGTHYVAPRAITAEIGLLFSFQTYFRAEVSTGDQVSSGS